MDIEEHIARLEDRVEKMSLDVAVMHGKLDAILVQLTAFMEQNAPATDGKVVPAPMPTARLVKG